MSKKTPRDFTEPTPDEDPRFRTYPTLEWHGVIYQKGDPIKIEGERGPFTFHYASPTIDDIPTITVWWEGHHFRSFYADRIAGTGPARPALCPIHPHYTATRRPRSGCGSCYAAYEAAHPDRVK